MATPRILDKKNIFLLTEEKVKYSERAYRLYIISHLKFIPRPDQSHDPPAFAPEFLPEVLYMHVHGTGGSGKVIPPNPVQKLLPGEDLFRVLHEG